MHSPHRFKRYCKLNPASLYFFHVTNGIWVTYGCVTQDAAVSCGIMRVWFESCEWCVRADPVKSPQNE